MIEEKEMETLKSCKAGFLQGLVSITMIVGVFLVPSLSIRALTGNVPVVPDYLITFAEFMPLTAATGFIVASICDFLKESKFKTIFVAIVGLSLVLLLLEGFVFVYLVGNGINF